MTKPLLLFLLFFSLITLPNLIKQNVIGDEPVYILEGDFYTHNFGKFYNNSGSPHLLKTISGLMIYSLPLNRDYSAYFKNTNTDVSSSPNFIYKQNPQFAKQLIILTRIPQFILSLLLGVAIYIFTFKNFSKNAAYIVLILYATNSTILSNAPTSNLDIGTAAFMFASVVCFYYFLKSKKPHSLKLLLLTGILLGLSQATKISAVLLYPIFAMYFFVGKTEKTDYKEKTLKQLLAVFAISFLTLWAVYLFNIGPIIQPQDKSIGIETIYSNIPFLSSYSKNITDFLRMPIFPLGAYLNNFTYQSSHGYYGHTMYLNGQFTDHASIYHLPILFFIKNSLTLFALIALSLYTTIRISKKQLQQQYLLIISIVIIFLWAITSPIQLGVRYLIPVFPFLFIWIGVNISNWIDARKLSKNKNNISRFNKLLIIATITLYAISNILYFPNFFAYRGESSHFTNPLEQITDSDYDWGQNIYLLSEFQKSNYLYPLFFKSDSGANLEYYKIKKSGDPVENLNLKKPGYYAFSHTSLVSLKKQNPTVYSYFAFRQPDYTIGENIYIYRLTSF